MTRRWFAMNSRHSSSPDSDAPSLGRAWPWLLAAGPALVVVASLATAWIAVDKDDHVVAENYYKIGLTINRRIAMAPAPTPLPGATVSIDVDGAVRVHLSASTPMPSTVQLRAARPGDNVHASLVTLTRAGKDFVGALPRGEGRWIVTLRSDTWQLPTTIVRHLPATITLGNVEAAS